MNEPPVKQIYMHGAELTVDWLIYRSYAENRERNPNIEPSRWRQLYLNQSLYEEIYQGEKNELNSIC